MEYLSLLVGLTFLYFAQLFLGLCSTIYLVVEDEPFYSVSSYHLPVTIIVLCLSSVFVNGLSLFLLLYKKEEPMNTASCVLHVLQCGVFWRMWAQWRTSEGNVEHFTAVVVLFSYLYTLPVATIQLSHLLKGGDALILAFVTIKAASVALVTFLMYRLFAIRLKLEEKCTNSKLKPAKVTLFSGTVCIPDSPNEHAVTSEHNEAILLGILNITAIILFLMGRLVAMACLVCIWGLISGIFILLRWVCCILYLYYHSPNLWPEYADEPDCWGRLLLHGFLLVFDWSAKRDEYAGFGLCNVSQVMMYYSLTLLESVIAISLWMGVVFQNVTMHFFSQVKASSYEVSYSVAGIGLLCSFISLIVIASSTLWVRSLTVQQFLSHIFPSDCSSCAFGSIKRKDRKSERKHQKTLPTSLMNSASVEQEPSRRPSSTYVDFKDIDDIVGFPIIHGIQTLGRSIASHVNAVRRPSKESTGRSSQEGANSGFEAVSDNKPDSFGSANSDRRQSTGFSSQSMASSFNEARKALTSCFSKHLVGAESRSAEQEKGICPSERKIEVAKSIPGMDQERVWNARAEDGDEMSSVSLRSLPFDSTVSSPAILHIGPLQHHQCKLQETRYYPAKSNLVCAWTTEPNEKSGKHGLDNLMPAKEGFLDDVLSLSQHSSNPNLSVLPRYMYPKIQSTPPTNPRMIQELEVYI